MELNLEGRTALVTGASYGLGYGCAHGLASEGVRVAISSRSQDKLTSAAQTLASETGSDIETIAADLTVREDLDGLIEQAETRLGQIDILVLSTGHPPTYPFSTATDEHWERGIDLLLWPPIVLARKALEGMRSRKYGRVIFIGSIRGIEPEKSTVVQCTLRTGLNAFAKCIADEVAPDGVTVNVVCPGYFDTPLVHDLAGQYANDEGKSVEQVLDEWKEHSPVNQFGDPKDLGALISFIASPRAAFMTGTSITMDGGAVRQW